MSLYSVSASRVSILALSMIMMLGFVWVPFWLELLSLAAGKVVSACSDATSRNSDARQSSIETSFSLAWFQVAEASCKVLYLS